MLNRNNLTVAEVGNIYAHIEDMDALLELRDNLYSLVKSIPFGQLHALKANKTLPNITIRIINEIEKIAMRQEQEQENEI